MNSFIGWIGGKRSLREKIIKEFPQNFNKYVEVFGGAGWVLFAREKHAKEEVFNDMNSNLINLYRCVKYHAEELQKELEFILVSREQFLDYKEQIAMRGLTDIQRAARYFILIKTSFGCKMSEFSQRGINLMKASDYLFEIQKRLKQVTIENESYEKIIKRYDKKDTLFYLDPPYFGTERYYKTDFETEHNNLANALKNIKGKFLLSYNDCEEIRELYKDFSILELERKNNLSSEKEAIYKELLIKNF